MHNFFKRFLISELIVVASVSACDFSDPPKIAAREGDSIRVSGGYARTNRLFGKVCIDGVTYITYGDSLSVMLDANSKIIPCSQAKYGNS